MKTVFMAAALLAALSVGAPGWALAPGEGLSAEVGHGGGCFGGATSSSTAAGARGGGGAPPGGGGGVAARDASAVDAAVDASSASSPRAVSGRAAQVAAWAGKAVRAQAREQ